MKSFSPLFLLAALGALSVGASTAVAAVDTSQWKCESCPFEKSGVSGTVDIGVGAVSDASAKFGDFTGLQKQGAYLVAGGTARYRAESGWYGQLSASELGIDTRQLAGEIGLEGVYSLRLRYGEIPRHLGNGASTPFLGVGGSVLTLPGGFPALDTAAMPLAATLQSVDIGYKRSRLDAGLSYEVGQGWSTRISARHEVRDGTQRIGGSFFSSSSQLIAPVDQVTDQLEVSTTYFSRRLQATLAYQGSLFRNGPDSLTWTNPFVPVVSGGNTGQLALAPDNQFHQLSASAGYELAPGIRASGDIAVGRMTQDASFLAATLNPNLVVPALPASSLNGRVDTFNASLRLTATPIERLRLNASYVRDVRDNRTTSLAYPLVSTDTFVSVLTRNNQPFSFTQDRFKLNADYSGPGSLKTSVGAEQNNIQRTLQEVVTTRESTLWGRASVQVRDNISLALKLSHADRSHSTYGSATWVDPPENPLLRKFYLADRVRDSGGARAEIALGETINIGLSADVAKDDYAHSAIGLTDGRSVNGGVDVSVAVNDQTQVHAFVQGERIRSRQAGSQVFTTPDWTGRTQDGVSVAGIGVQHTALKGKLELAGDLTFARSRSEVTVDAGASSPPFPTAKTALDSLKLRATYKLQQNLSVIGSYWYERYDATDWHFDGLLPATVPNLLALGEQPPRYHISVIQVALRYRF
jgi:MtrB/PioB family decaheme-associated outer membrane protein